MNATGHKNVASQDSYTAGPTSSKHAEMSSILGSLSKEISNQITTVVRCQARDTHDDESSSDTSLQSKYLNSH